MTAQKRSDLWMKSIQAAILAIAVCFSLGATDSNSRLYNLSHRMMCTCGCAQILGECNHVGCTASTQQLAEVRAAIANGLNDQQILDAAVAKYGATVLAAPSKKGLDLVAWIAPFAVFGAALLGTILLVRRWSIGRTLATAGDPLAIDPAERERREKIRRETGDGGF